ncbi:hypothetical protein QBC40DRAFT_313184 [Triangularia verruculosa]|uniref:DUF6546 domain-containing protein n=1 Tax=Triangularia verruculosa TaxID=2587418 RepID=A0AAN7ARG1_9PEZI|nr:hypothetical protein QBC40DRAFT_313184 [Triangularia verruculosa]
MEHIASPSGFHWDTLPAEIRLMILETATERKYPGCKWSFLASVCKEWQLMVEKRNFERLNLRESCMKDFGRIIQRQRELVRHICFNVESPDRCLSCGIPGCRRASSITFAIGLHNLFGILSTWSLSKGLTLELNTYAPSSVYRVREDDIKLWGERRGIEEENPWDHFRRPSVGRRSDSHLKYSLESLPTVESVTCFIIPRQLRRDLWIENMWQILSTLPCLEHLIYEPWQASTRYKVKIRDDLLQHYLNTETFPVALRKVSVFEESGDEISGRTRGLPESEKRAADRRLAERQLAAAFASRSLTPDELSLSYIIDAQDFFKTCQPTWTWQSLESLSLTSKQLRFTVDRKDLDKLLLEAGKTALCMPKLKTLVLWSGENDACAFIYQTRNDHASITWRGTWGMEFSPAVVDLWRRVAFEGHSRHALRVNRENIDAIIQCRGDAIHHLELPCEVVSPASLRHMRKESGSNSAGMGLVQT